ncbi:MAG: hypothetical protein DRH57_09280 [Candidatus Cloacimonadota bacterium]|nr:MAG: hypothetical protein DRH57_09280 [Candidatus Cloacimonadota bacterium]
MNRTKDITIQVWIDSTFVRTIGIWYPPIADTKTASAEEESFNTELIDTNVDTFEAMEEVQPEILPMEQGAPFIIVTSSMFDPRDETTGVSPIVVGQSSIPKAFLETTIRNMSYLFANEISMFQPRTKAFANIFLTKQTFSYTMVKEETMTVTPVQGSQTLKDLGDFINQFSVEEQEQMKVINNTEKPETTASKHIEEFIFGDKVDGQSMYITVTKLADIYDTEDPYINMTQIPENSTDALPPALVGTPEGDAIVENAEAVIEADTAERETLEAYDNIVEADEMTEESETEVIEPTREEALEELLKMKNQQLMDAGIIPPTTPENPLDGLPEPSTQSEDYAEVSKTITIDAETQDDMDYAAMTAAPTND